MANIDIRLNLSTINAFNAHNAGVGTVSLVDTVDLLFQASYNFGNNHAGYTTGLFSGDRLQLQFPDGAYSQYYGVSLANPNATTGEATATNMVNEQPSAYRLNVSGYMNYHYASNADGSFILQNTGGTINYADLQTLLPTTSPGYDATLGNVDLGVGGAMTLSQSGNLSGSITSLTTHADMLVRTGELTGNFSVNGNVNSIGQGLSSASVSGVADAFIEQYTDGSVVSLSNLALAINGNTVVSEKLLFDGANLPSDDIINITLATSLATPWALASGAGNDSVMITGGGATLSVNAGTGNDFIRLGDDGHSVDGGEGIDTMQFSGGRAAYKLTKAGAGYTLQDQAPGGAVDTLVNVERLKFIDSISVALDTGGDGIAGQAYRLYQAAFNRTPDAEGVGFWMHYMDGGMSLNQVAGFFVTSPEFIGLYGANLSNADMIDKLYHNVLHRAGDADGVKFWTHYMEVDGGTQAKMLAFFGQSPENQAALVGVIGNGFEYIPSQG
jgi:hypothetical protein